jgi:dihydroorotate dehydrogenase
MRPVLFSRESETVHNETIEALAWMSRHPAFCDLAASFCEAPELPVHLWGLRFPNPVGLAAGMDKQAVAAPIWPALGFGFSELGGVTQLAQPGNPAPRMFRLVSEEALINRMGFNNPGADAIAQTLGQWKASGRWPVHPVGINLGKSKLTALENAAEDYAYSFRALWGLADFFVVNVSSPNTPNLRQLQDREALRDILLQLHSVQNELLATKSPMVGASSASAGRKPILVKVAPDLSWEALDDIVGLVESCQLSGIVATNTTLARPESSDPALQGLLAETGGLSGRPLKRRSTEVVRHLYRQLQGRVPIIGVGGIFTAEDAWEKIQAGASLVQVYSGLVYEGPTLCRDIVSGLKEKVAAAGLRSISEAVGSDVR